MCFIFFILFEISDELEIDTSGKILFVGTDDGFLKGFGLHSRVQV